MKTKEQAEAEYAASGILAEGNYTQLVTTMQRGLQRAMQIEAAIATFRISLYRARAAFEADLSAIETNSRSAESE